MLEGPPRATAPGGGFWAGARPWLLLLAAAFGLRALSAWVTEERPLFPNYYYMDAALVDNEAVRIEQAWSTGQSSEATLSPSARLHARLVAAVYLAAGHRPLAAKLLHCLLAALAVGLLALAVRAAFGPEAAFWTAAITALWPSHVFFGSQLLKDPLVWLFSYGSMASFLMALSRPRADGRFALLLACMDACLFCIGLLRGYILLTLAAAMAAVSLGLWLARRSRPAACALAALAALGLFYSGVSRFVQYSTLPPAQRHSTDPSLIHTTIPSTFKYEPPKPEPPRSERKAPESAPLRAGRRGTSRYVYPFTPQGIAEFRRIRQSADRGYAQTHSARLIGTQLFPGLEFRGWGDLLAFLPRGAFYSLFMPLPGLYPTGGRLGRALASWENLLLLSLALLCLAGAARGGWSAGHALFAAVFAAMTAGSALLEFDLGSATRHKTFYLPLLFPFALGLRRVRGPAAGRRRVFEVLECGGPGGTGNQVAAICNGLDPARFETWLVYAVRPAGSPQDYEAAASGAARRVHLPEMTREISPLRDLRALRALYRLFARERPDVVHAHSSKAGFLARVAAWAAGVPRIYYSPRGYSFLQDDRGPWSRLLYRALELSVSWIGTVVAVSPSEAALAREKAGAARVRVVRDAYLGAPSPGAGPGDAGRKERLVCAMGRLCHPRHPEAFVRLAQRLTDSRNGLRCLWIGDGELGPRVREMVRDLNLAGRLELTGWLPPEEARGRLRGGSLFVHYSRWEGLPNAVLDAMASGLPVVASDAPGNRDLVRDGENGFLVQDEIALLERSLQLLDDPELAAGLGERGKALVREQYSRERLLAELTGLYAE